MCNTFTLEKIRWVESNFFENICRVFAYLMWVVMTGTRQRIFCRVLKCGHTTKDLLPCARMPCARISAHGKKTAHDIQAVSGSEFSNNHFPIASIVRCPNSNFRIIGEISFAISQWSHPIPTILLEKSELPLYLGRVGGELLCCSNNYWEKKV